MVHRLHLTGMKGRKLSSVFELKIQSYHNSDIWFQILPIELKNS